MGRGIDVAWHQYHWCFGSDTCGNEALIEKNEELEKKLSQQQEAIDFLKVELEKMKSKMTQ